MCFSCLLHLVAWGRQHFLTDLKTEHPRAGSSPCTPFWRMDYVFLVAAVLLMELSTKRTGLALKDTMGYYSVLFTVETKSPCPRPRI